LCHLFITPICTDNISAIENVQPLTWSAGPIMNTQERSHLLNERVTAQHRVYLIRQVSKREKRVTASKGNKRTIKRLSVASAGPIMNTQERSHLLNERVTAQHRDYLIRQVSKRKNRVTASKGNKLKIKRLSVATEGEDNDYDDVEEAGVIGVHIQGDWLDDPNSKKQKNCIQRAKL
jgi:sRNA-binding protein